MGLMEEKERIRFVEKLFERMRNKKEGLNIMIEII
jgi:hypothetical protein